jgi:hypothetical protein
MATNPPGLSILDAPREYTMDQASAWSAGVRAALAHVVAASCAECGKTSTRDSMWALYCVGCIESKVIPALASEKDSSSD